MTVPLDELRTLLEKATPRPWRSRTNDQRPYKHIAFGAKRDEPYTTSPLEAADADLIVAAVNHLDALIACVEALEGALADFEQMAAELPRDVWAFGNDIFATDKAVDARTVAIAEAKSIRAALAALSQGPSA